MRFLLLILSAVGIFLLLWGNTALETSCYTVASEALPDTFSGFRIAQVSDLHNTSFGNENEKLLQMISEAEPDVIVITGDIVDSRRTDMAVAFSFVDRAAEIAPVYYAAGNHESRMEYAVLKAGLQEAGAVVLDNETVNLERQGEQIHLMGMLDPEFGEDPLISLSQLMDMTHGFTILLSHRPELFDVYAQSNVNLVFSGHAHGGQFRLPLLGGVIAPGQGLFPHYDAGVFTQGNTTMVVSRGLGNSIVPLRVGNRPELVIVQLVHSG